ncbi:DUF502 domain-containing protein [Verrucomicrobium sp. BvORR034]|jgi:uncharacterized membrane protein|uniref:DUF502 domain-containing protein n=1 Tax=Verrucomicrobium sp. BvORR034 TaxID=1396418 RepID=UPI0006797682|nr:DUF502 domain-containing protein [Verrucomicrobium sp. BvORR034]
MADPTPPPLRHPIIWVRNKFLAGLALVTPLVVTFWILQIVYATLKQVSIPLLEFFAAIYNQAVPVAWMIDTHDPRLLQFMNFLGFLIPIVFLVALGVMATNVLGVRVVSALEKFLLRIPLVAFIYKFMKQVMDSFKGFGGVKSFKRVVYVDYPSPGLKLLGFVTGQYVDPKSGAGMSAVLLPAALSPMTGLVIVTETSRLEDAPLTVEEAMKLIVSGGLISPKTEEEKRAEAAVAAAGKVRSKGKSKTATSSEPVPVPESDFVNLPKADEELLRDDGELSAKAAAAAKPVSGAGGEKESATSLTLKGAALASAGNGKL